MTKQLIIALLTIVCSSTYNYAGNISFVELDHSINQLQSIKEVRKIADKKLSAYLSFKDPETLLEYKYAIANIALRKNDYTKAMKLLFWLKHHGNKNPEVLLVSYYHLSYLLANNNQTDIALYYAKKTLPLSLKHSNYRIELTRLIGQLYFEKKNYLKAISYYWICYQYFKKNDKVLASSQLNNIAICYQEMKNFAKAREFYRQSIELIKKSNSQEHAQLENLYIGNLGSCLYDEKKYTKAIPYLEKDVFYCLNNNDFYDLYFQLYQLNDCYEKNNNVTKSQALVQKLKELKIDTLMLDNDVPFLSQFNYFYYKKHNDDHKALYYANTMIDQLKRYQKNVSSKQIELAHTMFKEQIHFFEQEIINQKKITHQTASEKRLWIIFLMLFTILFITILILISINAVKKRVVFKQEYEIEQQKHIIDRQQLQLLETENQRKNDQLESLFLMLQLKKETEIILLEKLKSIKQNNTQNSTEILKDLQILLSNLLSMDQKKDTMESTLEHYHMTIRELLQQSLPILSEPEITLCSYFRLGLSAKQIAIIQGTTDGVIRVYKTKIKRKIGLNTDQSLDSYLKEIKVNTIPQPL